MKDNLTTILEAFANNPDVSNKFDSAPLFKDVIDNTANIGSSFDSAPLFNNIFTNMPELENFRLTFNLFYRQLYLDSVSAEDFFYRLVSFNRLIEDASQVLDSVEKLHNPIEVHDDKFFAFQDSFETLLREFRVIENILDVRTPFLVGKSSLASERILSSDAFSKTLQPITLEEQQFFAIMGEVALELIRDTRFVSFADVRDFAIVSKPLLFLDRGLTRDNEIAKILGLTSEEDKLNALDNFFEMLVITAAGGSLEQLNVNDYFLSAAPLFTLDRITNEELTRIFSTLRLSEQRPDFTPDIVNTLEQHNTLLATTISDSKEARDTFIEAKSVIFSDRFFSDILSQNLYGINFTGEKDPRAEEIVKFSAGGVEKRRIRTTKPANNDYSLVDFLVNLGSRSDKLSVKNSNILYGRQVINKEILSALSKIEKFLVGKSLIDTINASALRKDASFFFVLASVLETIGIKDYFYSPNGLVLGREKVDANDSTLINSIKLSKTYPQFFYGKGSVRQFSSRVGNNHPFYYSNPAKETGDVYRSAPAPWEDFVQIGSDGSGAGYIESSSSPLRYTWRVLAGQSDITVGSWVNFGARWPIENIPGKRRINFLLRRPQPGAGLYTPFTGLSYLEYGPKWLKNAGIFEINSKPFVSNSFRAFSNSKIIANDVKLLNDRFNIGEEDVDVILLPFYLENLDILEYIGKYFEIELNNQLVFSNISTPVIANDYEILRDLFYSDELLIDLILEKGKRDRVNASSIFKKQPTFKFNESLELKSPSVLAAKSARITRDLFYINEIVDAIDVSPKNEEILSLFDINHRLIDNLTPESSFILANEKKLSTKVDFIRNEKIQDSTNVTGFTTESSGIKTFDIENQISIFNYAPPVTLSVPISVQNLLSQNSVIKSYSISSINVIGPAEVYLRVKNNGQEFKSYSSGINIWREASKTYTVPTLEIEALIPYSYYGGAYYFSNFNSLKVEVTFDITFSGGKVEFTGDPAEFPFVNNIQSADSGSAFINIYCSEYSLELYVGEEGTYATF